MEKEFVTYEQALALKELGFDEPCLAYYQKSAVIDDTTILPIQIVNKASNFNDGGYSKMGVPFYSAPTFSQAFRWFREKYGLRNSITDFIDDEKGIEWDYEIAIIGTDLDERGNYKPLVDYSTDDETRKFKTYEEAELACLIKLIEIVKEKKQ